MAPAETREADFEAAEKLFVAPPRSRRKLAILAASLAFFALIFIAKGGGSYLDLALIVGVLFVHEVGHAVAMLVFGYRDVQIFFIPLLGAAASGRPLGVARWKQAIVLLAGPMPGLVVGCVLRVIATRGSELMHVAVIAILINAVNLLPVEPLDGGRLFQVLVFSRNRYLESAFRIVTAGLLVAVSLYLEMWALAFFGYLVLVTWAQYARVARAGEALKTADLPEDPAALDEAQRRTLYEATWTTFAPLTQQKIRGKPRAQAFWMEQVHQRAILRAPSWLATLSVLALWAGGIGLALYTVVPLVHHTVTWQAYQGTSFHVDIPNDGRVLKDTATYWAYTDDHSLFGIRHQLLANAATDYVTEVEAKLDATPTDRPHEFVKDIKGKQMRMRVIAPGADRIGYILEAWPDNDVGRHFLDSFTPSP